MKYTQPFKHTLADMLCHKIKENHQVKLLEVYESLLQPCKQWADGEYRLAAEITNLSASTLKRLFLPNNYQHNTFNQRSQKLFCAFLGYNEWEDLVDEINRRIYANL
jgi:hypothetical protein